MPDTIAAVLELRMSRLSSACQRFLGNAAVLGGSFTFHIIAQLETSGAANSMSEDTLLDLIEEAIQAGVLTEEGTGTRITYHFWHPLLVSHLYDQLSAARRARLHRRAAEVLQRVYSGREAENAATITNHLLKGGAEAERIVHFAELAADRAYSLSAYPEAEQYYRIAVAQLDEQNDSSLPAAPEELEHLSYLLERLGECMRVQGNSAEARSAYERVLSMRHQQHNSASIVNEQHEAQIDAILWREISLTWYDIGNTTLARQSCEHGEQVLREAGVEAGPAWAILRFEQSYIYWREGNYDMARQMAQEAQKLFEDTLQNQEHAEATDVRMTITKRTLAGDPTNLGRIHALLGMVANSVGQPKEALAHLNTALTLFEQADLQREIANTCCNIGDIQLRKTEHEFAQAFFRRSLNLAQRVGDIPLMSVVYCNLGEVATRSGDLQEAETIFKSGLALAEKINERVYINVLCVDLAIVTQDQDKLAEAGTYIYQALMAGRSIRNTPCISLALVALGNWRIAQAIKLRQAQTHTDPSIRLLQRARKTLKRALASEGLDAETRIKGQLAIAHILLLLGETETAQQLAVSTMEEAQQSELLWGYLCAQRLLGDILETQGQQKQAEYHFVQAMQAFQTSGMRLEYARTLYSYGTALLQTKGTEKARNHQQGLSYLHEAQQIFSECHALLDLHSVESVLTAQPAMKMRL